MLKLSIFTLLSAVAVNAFADTHTFFSSDKGTVLIQGKAGDKDAINLFNAMTTQAVDAGSYLEKKLSFSSSAKEQLFTVTCKLSKSISDYGSCTLTVLKSQISVIQPDENFISLMIQYPDSTAALKEFVSPQATDPDGEIFMSTDRHLGIYSYPGDHSMHIFYR